MSDAPAGEAQPPREALLVAVARQQGDARLFPDEVLRLHAEGRARRARKVLLEYARTERDQGRAATQRRVASDLRLWLEPLRGAPTMFTFNGIGTRLYGSYQGDADGTSIATLWITIIFLPVWPLAAYLVAPAEGKNAWTFYARAPFPPFARHMQRITAGAVAAAVLWLAWKAYWASRHTDLYVFNGFDRAVIAQVGGQRSRVAARSHRAFHDLPAKTTSVGASWEGEPAPFETLEARLGGHGGHTAIYNVADRAVLSLRYVSYGPRAPREGRWLERGPVVFVEEEIDYPFETPPPSRDVSEGSSVEMSVLSAADEGAAPSEVVEALARAQRREQALAVAKAELTVHPEDAGLAFAAARLLLGGDLDAQVALLRWCLERAPGAVDLHRAYQELWPADRRDALRREYAALLAANQRSPMYHYLAGRLEENGSAAEQEHYRVALTLDASYPPLIRALGFRALVLGRWTEALAHYDRYSSLGKREASESLDPRLRIRSRLGRPGAELERIITRTAAQLEEPVYLSLLLAHLRIQARAAAFAGESRRVLAAIGSGLGGDSSSPVQRNAVAALAVTAGDLPLARRALAEIAGPRDRSAATALRIALSDGGTRADAELLFGIPDWQIRLDPPQRLMALTLLEPERREELAATLEGEAAAAARLLGNRGEPLRPERLDQLVRGAPATRAAAFFAASRVLAASRDPAAARARGEFLLGARSWALPGELPYLRAGAAALR